MKIVQLRPSCRDYCLPNVPYYIMMTVQRRRCNVDRFHCLVYYTGDVKIGRIHLTTTTTTITITNRDYFFASGLWFVVYDHPIYKKERERTSSQPLNSFGHEPTQYNIHLFFTFILFVVTMTATHTETIYYATLFGLCNV